MKTLEDIIKILKENEEYIEKEFKAKIVGIFGSYVHGGQKEDSDLDIIVRFKDDATLLDIAGLNVFLEEKLGIEVDIVSEKAIRPELKKRILNEKITI